MKVIICAIQYYAVIIIPTCIILQNFFYYINLLNFFVSLNLFLDVGNIVMIRFVRWQPLNYL